MTAVQNKIDRQMDIRTLQKMDADIKLTQTITRNIDAFMPIISTVIICYFCLASINTLCEIVRTWKYKGG